MKTKGKAIELYNKFRNENAVLSANVRAKKQAIIAVDEIINAFQELHNKDIYYNGDEYWVEVKQEINKL